MNEVAPGLEELAAELEAVADKLRSEAVDTDEAADLVERCAELAQRIGAELDAAAARPARRRARSGCCDATDTALYPVELQRQVDDYLRDLRFSVGARHRAARRGHALLAARRRQAHPAGARARHRRGASGARPPRCCRWRPRSR